MNLPNLPTVTIGDEKRVTERMGPKLDATVTVGGQARFADRDDWRRKARYRAYGAEVGRDCDGRRPMLDATVTVGGQRKVVEDQI